MPHATRPAILVTLMTMAALAAPAGTAGAPAAWNGGGAGACRDPWTNGAPLVACDVALDMRLTLPPCAGDLCTLFLNATAVASADAPGLLRLDVDLLLDEPHRICGAIDLGEDVACEMEEVMEFRVSPGHCAVLWAHAKLDYQLGLESAASSTMLLVCNHPDGTPTIHQP